MPEMLKCRGGPLAAAPSASAEIPATLPET
jgi:hypothetical protein